MSLILPLSREELFFIYLCITCRYRLCLIESKEKFNKLCTEANFLNNVIYLPPVIMMKTSGWLLVQAIINKKDRKQHAISNVSFYFWNTLTIMHRETYEMKIDQVTYLVVFMTIISMVLFLVNLHLRVLI